MSRENLTKAWREEAELYAYLGYVSPRNQPTPPKPAGSVLPEKLNRFSNHDMAKAWVRGYRAGTEDADAYLMGRQWYPKPNPHEGDNKVNPEDAIQAAARALHETTRETWEPIWDYLHEKTQRRLRKQARTILEAADPYQPRRPGAVILNEDGTWSHVPEAEQHKISSIEELRMLPKRTIMLSSKVNTAGIHHILDWIGPKGTLLVSGFFLPEREWAAYLPAHIIWQGHLFKDGNQ